MARKLKWIASRDRQLTSRLLDLFELGNPISPPCILIDRVYGKWEPDSEMVSINKIVSEMIDSELLININAVKIDIFIDLQSFWITGRSSWVITDANLITEVLYHQIVHQFYPRQISQTSNLFAWGLYQHNFLACAFWRRTASDRLAWFALLGWWWAILNIHPYDHQRSLFTHFGVKYRRETKHTKWE